MPDVATITAAPLADTVVLPIDVHVFVHQSQWYAFDTRNFTVLTLDAEAAAVLSLAHERPLNALVDALSGTMTPAAVQAHYLRILDMLDDGTLSSTPVPAPTPAPFNHLVIMLAGGCNMGCTYCFERDVPVYQHPNLLTRAKADEILAWFFRYHEGPTAHVQLYGGEPLLNWPVLQHVVQRAESWAGQSGVELTKYLITNGTLLTAERIAWLKNHRVTIQVSVDGETRTHDRFRVFKNGKPTLPVIRDAVSALDRQDADYNMRAVVTRAELDPAAVIDGLRSIGDGRVSFEVVATEDASTRLTADDWERFLEGHARFVQAPADSWAELPESVKSTILKICEQRRVFYGCGAGVSEVTVAPDGNIYECQRLYREPYGNVADGRGPKELGSRFLTMVDERPVCRDCWARYLCGGGCLHQAHVEHGSNAPLPQYCRMKHTLVEASIVALSRIGAGVHSVAPSHSPDVAERAER
jgi:uncharacterized protein